MDRNAIWKWLILIVLLAGSMAVVSPPLDKRDADGNVVRRGPDNENTWTGDFRLWTEQDWRGAIRPNAHYCGLATDETSLDELLTIYDETYPPQDTKIAPGVTGVEL